MELIARGERVRVLRQGSLFEVEVGGRRSLVDAALVRPGVYSLRIDGAQHEVAVRPRGESTWWVSTARGTEAVELTDPLAFLASQSAGGGGSRRRQRVNAYMPGRVVATLVAEGAEVVAGQGIVVLEAMKMQNEIQAEHDGTVTRLHVQPGQSVDGGDPLFDLV